MSANIPEGGRKDGVQPMEFLHNPGLILATPMVIPLRPTIPRASRYPWPPALKRKLKNA